MTISLSIEALFCKSATKGVKNPKNLFAWFMDGPLKESGSFHALMPV